MVRGGAPTTQWDMSYSSARRYAYFKWCSWMLMICSVFFTCAQSRRVLEVPLENRRNWSTRTVTVPEIKEATYVDAVHFNDSVWMIPCCEPLNILQIPLTGTDDAKVFSFSDRSGAELSPLSGQVTTGMEVPSAFTFVSDDQTRKCPQCAFSKAVLVSELGLLYLVPDGATCAAVVVVGHHSSSHQETIGTVRDLCSVWNTSAESSQSAGFSTGAFVPSGAAVWMFPRHGERVLQLYLNHSVASFCPYGSCSFPKNFSGSAVSDGSFVWAGLIGEILKFSSGSQVLNTAIVSAPCVHLAVLDIGLLCVYISADTTSFGEQTNVSFNVYNKVSAFPAPLKSFAWSSPGGSKNPSIRGFFKEDSVRVWMIISYEGATKSAAAQWVLVAVRADLRETITVPVPPSVDHEQISGPQYLLNTTFSIAQRLTDDGIYDFKFGYFDKHRVCIISTSPATPLDVAIFCLNLSETSLTHSASFSANEVTATATRDSESSSVQEDTTTTTTTTSGVSIQRSVAAVSLSHLRVNSEPLTEPPVLSAPHFAALSSVAASQSVAASASTVAMIFSSVDVSSAQTQSMVTVLSCSRSPAPVSSSKKAHSEDGRENVLTSLGSIPASTAYAISVFYNLGPSAIAAGNALVLLSVIVFHALAVHVYAWRRVDTTVTTFAQASATFLRFPAASLTLAKFLLPGCVFGGVVVLTAETSSSAEISIGVLSLLFAFSCVVGEYVLQTQFVVPVATWEVYTQLPLSSLHGGFSLAGAAQRLLPAGRWAPKTLRNQFGPLIDSVKRRYVRLSLVDLVQSLIISAASGVGTLATAATPTRVLSCHVMVYVSALLALAAGMVSLALRPYRRPLDRWCVPMQHFMMSLVCVLKANSSTDDNVDMSTSIAAVQLLQSVVMITKLVGGFWVSYQESRWEAEVAAESTALSGSSESKTSGWRSVLSVVGSVLWFGGGGLQRTTESFAATYTRAAQSLTEEDLDDIGAAEMYSIELRAARLDKSDVARLDSFRPALLYPEASVDVEQSDASPPLLLPEQSTTFAEVEKTAAVNVPSVPMLHDDVGAEILSERNRKSGVLQLSETSRVSDSEMSLLCESSVRSTGGDSLFSFASGTPLVQSIIERGTDDDIEL